MHYHNVVERERLQLQRCLHLEYPQCHIVPFVLRWRLREYIARQEGCMYRASINLLGLPEISREPSKIRDIADTV